MTDATTHGKAYIQASYHSLPILPVLAEWVIPVGSNLVAITIRGHTKVTVEDLNSLVEYLLLFRKQFKVPNPETQEPQP